MASFHISKRLLIDTSSTISSRFIQAMMKLSSLNYFHLFKRGDELLNAYACRLSSRIETQLNVCFYTFYTRIGKENINLKTTEAYSFQKPAEANV